MTQYKMLSMSGVIEKLKSENVGLEFYTRIFEKLDAIFGHGYRPYSFRPEVVDFVIGMSKQPPVVQNFVFSLIDDCYTSKNKCSEITDSLKTLFMAIKPIIERENYEEK